MAENEKLNNVAVDNDVGTMEDLSLIHISGPRDA